MIRYSLLRLLNIAGASVCFWKVLFHRSSRHELLYRCTDPIYRLLLRSNLAFGGAFYVDMFRLAYDCVVLILSRCREIVTVHKTYMIMHKVLHHMKNYIMILKKNVQSNIKKRNQQYSQKYDYWLLNDNQRKD